MRLGLDTVHQFKVDFEKVLALSHGSSVLHKMNDSRREKINDHKVSMASSHKRCVSKS